MEEAVAGANPVVVGLGKLGVIADDFIVVLDSSPVLTQASTTSTTLVVEAWVKLSPAESGINPFVDPSAADLKS